MIIIYKCIYLYKMIFRAYLFIYNLFIIYVFIYVIGGQKII